jgi:hypothetical protein
MLYSLTLSFLTLTGFEIETAIHARLYDDPFGRFYHTRSTPTAHIK